MILLRIKRCMLAFSSGTFLPPVFFPKRKMDTETIGPTSTDVSRLLMSVLESIITAAIIFFAYFIRKIKSHSTLGTELRATFCSKWTWQFLSLFHHYPMMTYTFPLTHMAT
jgi:hypothetical protein